MNHEDVLKILEMVKEGRISPEEGRELIAALAEADRKEKGEESRRSSGMGGAARRGRGRVVGASFEGALRDLDIEGIVEASVEGATSWVDGLVDAVTHVSMGEIPEGPVRRGGPTGSVTLGPLPAGVSSLNIDAEVASASLTFRVHPRREVLVRYWGPTRPTPEVSLSGETLRIEYDFHQPHVFWGLRQENVTIEVIVPEELTLRGQTELQNGRLEMRVPSLRDFNGETLNGPISVTGKLMQAVSLETKNGLIAVAAGEVQELSAEAMNGKIDVAGVLEDVSLETLNGRLFAHAFPGSRGNLSAETARGAIRVRIPRGVGYRLDAASTLGTIHLNLADFSRSDEASHGSSRKINFSRGDEALRLNLESQVGTITVEEETA